MISERERNHIIEALKNAIPYAENGMINVSVEATNEIIEMLKEQKPLKPKSKVRHGENGQIQHFCRKCNAILFHHKQKFCIECGRRVKWE